MSFPKMTPFRVFRYNKGFPENYTEIFDNGRIVNVSDSSYVGMSSFGGWCNPDNPRDSVVNYLGEKFEVGYIRYVRSVPAKALKFAVNKAIEEERAATGKRTVSRARKKELKEEIKLRMLSRTPVQPTITRIEVNPSAMEITVFSSSNTVLEDIEDLMKRDFGISMFMETVIDYLPADDMVEVEGVGENFLTWLWYISESDSFNVFESRKMPSKRYTVSPDDRVIVGNADTGRCSVSGDIREAKNGVFNGKNVTQFSFVLYPDQDGIESHIPIPCVVNSGCLVDKISFKALPFSDGGDESEIEADALMCLDVIDDVRDFLKTAFSRFWEDYSNAEKWESRKHEIWMWARGDVCIRSFEGV